METTIDDVFNENGSVTRTTTSTFPNGDVNISKHIFSPAEYQKSIEADLNTIEKLTDKLERSKPIADQVKAKLEETAIPAEEINNAKE